MHRFLMALTLLLGVLLSAGGARADQGGVASETFTLQLGDFTSPAQLDYPAGKDGPFPTVVLYHGGCDCDRDEAFTNPDGSVQSRIFKDITDALVPRGFAVLRYNKRYVNGPGNVDPKFGQVTLAENVADAEAALAAARANPRVDQAKIYLYGWSEGTQIASAIAAKAPGIAGLVLQGPVAVGFVEGGLAQLESKIQFAASFSGGNTITAEGLKQALAQTNGWWASDFVDTSKTDGVAVNPYFDDNKDGVLDIATEVRPKLRAFLESQIAAGGYLGELAAFPTVADQAAKLRMPVLVLHGANDALTPRDTVVKLDPLFAGRPYTRKEYPGLGHSLGPTTSLIDMAGQFKPIAAEPLADLAGWLEARATTPARLPNTGGAEPNLWLLTLLGAGAIAAGLFLMFRSAHQDDAQSRTTTLSE